MIKKEDAFPSVQLTQQDFVSTFPWGARGDRVRILQQEVEDELLDAETLSAMAVMLGSRSFSARVEETWKMLLNSQNHDVHVCMQDEAGIDWCEGARVFAAGIRRDAGEYIAGVLGGKVEINTLSWDRRSTYGRMKVPAYGYAVKPPKADDTCAPAKPWIGWFQADGYSARLLPDGTIEVKIGKNDKNTAVLGNLTVYADGKTLDSRDDAPTPKEAVIAADGTQARVCLEGTLAGIRYIHHITITRTFIDFMTEFDYGDGINFGPDIKDFQAEPRRAHYFQHERKLCMNWGIAEENAELLYASPFLTWPADGKARSIESLHYAALQGREYGLAHMNVGQCGYGHQQKSSSCEHALAFSPRDYVYGNAEQLLLTGHHEHHYRFMPYIGDWRDAEVPLRTSEFLRPVLAAAPGPRRPRDASKAEMNAGSLLKIQANTTIATALFERMGKVYLRLWEWAGQEDDVEVIYGDDTAVFTECTHGLKAIGTLGKAFKMRPWEIKTIELVGKAVFLPLDEVSKAPKRFANIPSGWEIKSQFSCDGECAGERKEKGMVYFSVGYHDGFVRPLEKQTPTMEIELDRIEKIEGYTNSWEIGGSCWVRIAINEPEYIERLKKFLKNDSVEITGGTWCEPFSLIVSGESNIRQLLYGMEAIKASLDYDVRIYCNQEHATYAQMPQLLRSFGICAVVNRTQWAPYGYESALDAEVANWMGPDGTTMWLIPRYHSMDYTSYSRDPVHENLQNASVTGHSRIWRTEAGVEKMLLDALALGMDRPLYTMVEDIWADGLRATDEALALYESLPSVQFTNVTRYLRMLGVPV